LRTSNLLLEQGQDTATDAASLIAVKMRGAAQVVVIPTRRNWDSRAA
jgi:hypothetical protein